MDVPTFLTRAFRTALTTLGAVPVEIQGHRTNAVLGPLEEAEDLLLGGEGDHRTLTIALPTADLPFLPQKGGTVIAQDRQWKINLVQSHPGTVTTLTLHSPSRRTS